MSFPRKTTLFYLMFASILLVATSAYPETIEYEGLIEPHVVVEIGAPTDGIVAKVNVDRSSLVEKGQVLVELDSSVERAALAKAKAMATFNGEIGLQKTQLAFSKRVHQRVSTLAAISMHDKDQAKTEIILTEYRLKKAREKKILAQHELKKAQAMLNRRSIKSPIAGVVVERYVSIGEFVDSQPLLRVAQINPLRVEVIVPGHMFGKISPGMTATIIPELAEYGEHSATVTIVDKVIDSASNTFGVRLELPNPESQLPSGLKCRVQLEIDDAPDDANKVTAQIAPAHTHD